MRLKDNLRFPFLTVRFIGVFHLIGAVKFNCCSLSVHNVGQRCVQFWFFHGNTWWEHRVLKGVPMRAAKTTWRRVWQTRANLGWARCQWERTRGESQCRGCVLGFMTIWTSGQAIWMFSRKFIHFQSEVAHLPWNVYTPIPPLYTRMVSAPTCNAFAIQLILRNVWLYYCILSCTA